MDISIYFKGIEARDLAGDALSSGTLGRVMEINDGYDFPDYASADLAIIGVKDDRESPGNKGAGEAPDYVRKYLYRLFKGDHACKVVDLGNIEPGATLADTHYAVSTSITELIKRNTIPIIIGGSQELTYANYTAYEKLEQTVNLVTIDPAIDLGDPDNIEEVNTYLGKIILHTPNFLFNYANLAYQTYFVNPLVYDLMGKLYFDTLRLGEVQQDITSAEPALRDADILSFDISAIRQSDAPGNALATPNGLYGEEACRLVRYAGMSDKLSSVGFYELNPLMDHQGQTAHLVAQMIWYFIDGFYNRKKDFPIADKRDYLKYRVSLKDHDHELVFYKSQKSDRWWMDVPYPAGKQVRYARHHMVPCTYADYQLACKEEMPDKWWRAFQKLS